MPGQIFSYFWVSTSWILSLLQSRFAVLWLLYFRNFCCPEIYSSFDILELEEVSVDIFFSVNGFYFEEFLSYFDDATFLSSIPHFQQTEWAFLRLQGVTSSALSAYQDGCRARSVFAASGSTL